MIFPVNESEFQDETEFDLEQRSCFSPYFDFTCYAWLSGI